MTRIVQMVTFAKVAEAGSFAGAARGLGVNTSVTSKHVSQLERELGTKLLIRGTRSLRLTEAGAVYFRHCARIVEEVEHARQTVAEMQSAPRGCLRVSAPPGLISGLVVPWLPEFRRRFPQIELDVEAANRFVDLAEEGFDLALRVTDEPQPHLVARKLADMRIAVCAAPSYIARRGVPREPMDLLQHDCLQFTPPGLMSSSVFEKDGVRIDVPIRGSIRINHADPLRTLALGGLGVALLSSHLVHEDFREGRLIRLLPGWRPVVDAALYAVYLPNRFGTPKLRAFVEFLLEKFEPARRPRPGTVSRFRDS
ncbi:MAG: LysR family transcriptional regulator [Panacagrimonas sp.]